jgi:uncharacterized coiled-coil DUF342 family protein
MKKIVFVLLAMIFAGISVYAQTTDILTNSSIVKMVKAKLSDDLILDVIQTSEVQFDMSNDAINILKAEQVPDPVIEAMKTAARSQEKQPIAEPAKTPAQNAQNTPAAAITPVVATAAVVTPAAIQKPSVQAEVAVTPKIEPTQSQPQPLTPGVKAVVEPSEQAPVLETLSYVIPIRVLVTYYESEFVSLSAEISRWDKQIRDSVEGINRINGQINQIETELRAKKNADSKKYSAEILALNNKLDMQRARYKQAKKNMLLNGEDICKKLEDISSKKAASIGDNYDEARAQIKDMKIDPSRVGSAIPVTFTKLRIYDNTTKFLQPLSEMLVWHQNEIDELYKIAVRYNAKVKEVVEKDAELSKQLEPVNSKLDEYKTDTKKYKQEIATLKKQKSALEKQRKQVTDSMEADSNELAGTLKLLRSEIQHSSKERFADIIKNITFLFQEKPAL